MRARFWLVSLLILSAPSLMAAERVTEIDVTKTHAWALEGTAKQASALDRAGEKKNGVFPLVVAYQFKPDANEFLFVEQSVALPEPPTKLRMTLFGDGNGESVRVNITDANGETFQAYAAKVDWQGWKELDLPLNFASHWGGDNNGVMDAPLTFTALVVNAEKDQPKWSGRLSFAKIEAVSEPVEAVGAGSGAVTSGAANAITVDDFERANPQSVYQVWRGDQSSVELISSSEFKKDGNYSMQLSYKLSTTRSVPSWVSASFSPDRPLNWEGASAVNIWVKGDGSRNYFQVSFVDGKNRVWVYQDNEALKNLDWVLVRAEMADFRMPTIEPDAVPDLSKVRKAEMSVVGETATKDFSGRIWVDNFTVEGPGLEQAMAAPRAPVSQEVIDKSKIQFGDLLHLEYKQTPELSKQFLYYNTIYVRGSVKNLTLAADVVSEEKEAGQSARFVKSTSSLPIATEPEEARAPVQLAYINATIQNLHPNLASLSMGNLYTEYGRDIFSPLFGFKGLQAEGAVKDVSYNLFAIKHVFDSFTVGTRLQTTYFGTLLRVMAVGHNDTARRLGTAQVVEGTLKVVDNLELKTDRVSQDQVYYVDMDRNFWKDRFSINVAYAVNKFTVNAFKDVTDPADPKIDRRLFDPIDETGEMLQVTARLKEVPTKQTSLIVQYRRTDRAYKPRFRADPFTYDADISDVRGVNADFTQIVGHFKANYSYDYAVRGFDSEGYYRKIFKQYYGYYGWNRLDVVFGINMRQEKYGLEKNVRSSFTIDPRNPKHEDAIYYELFLGHWFTEDFYIWSKFLTEKVKTRFTDFKKDYFQLQGEWAVFKNAKFTLSLTQTRFDQRSFEPFATSAINTTGSRTFARNTEDNQVRLLFDVNF